MSQTRKDAAADFLQLAATGQAREAFRRHVAPGFRHHNAHFPGSADPLMRAMEENAQSNPGKSLAVKMTLEEGDRVMTLSHVHHQRGDKGFAVVHIFRFEGDQVAELWDLAQAIPESSPNDNGMF